MVTCIGCGPGSPAGAGGAINLGGLRVTCIGCGPGSPRGYWH